MSELKGLVSLVFILLLLCAPALIIAFWRWVL